MAQLNQNFAMFRGDTADVIVTLTDADGLPLDLTGALLRYGLGPMDASPPPTIKTSASALQIETSATEEVVTATIHLQPADTRDLMWMARQELQIIDAGGGVEMLMSGTVTINAAALNEEPDSEETMALELVSSSGPPMTPQPYLEVDLPADRPWFSFDVGRFTFSTGTLWALAFSYDGTTFPADPINNDTYGWGKDADTPDLFDSVFAASASVDPAVLIKNKLYIPRLWPGSADEVTSFLAETISGGARYNVLGYLNPLATVTPVPARAVKMRIFAYGDPNAPPDVPITWDAWQLWAPPAAA